MRTAAANKKLIFTSIKSPNKNIMPDKPKRMNSGRDAVTKPKKNLFQLSEIPPLSIKPVEFGKF